MYVYDTIAIISKGNRYVSYLEEADSFVSALTAFFTSVPEMVGSVCTIYCRKPISGDLQLMGEYDGLSVYMAKGENHSHILTLTNGSSYAWNGKRFVRDVIDFAQYLDA